MKYAISVLLLFLYACKGVETNDTTAGKQQRIILNLDDNRTPTVDIAKITLITENGNEQKEDAREIMAVKRRWPLAMQSLSRAAFDSILSKNFTFNAADEFYVRADYINNRTSPNDWQISNVKYENVTLQFFGERGVLSYVNVIENTHSKTNAIEYERISWVDVYVKEDNIWKINAAHAIDYAVEMK